MVKKYGELYMDAYRSIAQREDTQTATLYARNLLCKATGLSYAEVLQRRELYAAQEITNTMETLVSRVLDGEPLAYVLGEWDFYGMTLEVDKNVLIPRDDTCAVTGGAINQALFLDKEPRILDLCTGSGCIGLAMMAAMTVSSLTGTLIPMLFKKLKIDPAVASGPLITTINDLVAVVAYYGLAWLLLVNQLHIGG